MEISENEAYEAATLFRQSWTQEDVSLGLTSEAVERNCRHSRSRGKAGNCPDQTPLYLRGREDELYRM